MLGQQAQKIIKLSDFGWKNKALRMSGCDLSTKNPMEMETSLRSVDYIQMCDKYFSFASNILKAGGDLTTTNYGPLILIFIFTAKLVENVLCHDA